MHNYLLSEFLDAKGQTSDDYHSDAACKNVISHPSYVQWETKNHQKMIIDYQLYTITSAQ